MLKNTKFGSSWQSSWFQTSLSNEGSSVPVRFKCVFKPGEHAHPHSIHCPRPLHKFGHFKDKRMSLIDFLYSSLLYFPSSKSSFHIHFLRGLQLLLPSLVHLLGDDLRHMSITLSSPLPRKPRQCLPMLEWPECAHTVPMCYIQ